MHKTTLPRKFPKMKKLPKMARYYSGQIGTISFCNFPPEAHGGMSFPNRDIYPILGLKRPYCLRSQNVEFGLEIIGDVGAVFSDFSF